MVSFIGDPRPSLRRWRALPIYFKNLLQWRAQARGSSFQLRWRNLNFRSYDRFNSAGELDTHYFLQDIWAARHVAARKPARHVDVGSRIDGFVSHTLISTPVTYVDLRPLSLAVENLSFIQGSILQLPFASGSLESLSCLHVIEHIGLGRYGEPLDSEDYLLALRELSRVLAPGGVLLIGTPVGDEHVCFDAHRVFAPATIRRALAGLELEEFSLIPEGLMEVRRNVPLDVAAGQEYACGLFVFRKRSVALS